jgi:predicted anti-sigma-YlaC factor YlaD
MTGMRGMREWMCGRLRTRFSDYLEGRLPRHRQWQIAHHLAHCSACREVLASLGRTISAVRGLAAADVPQVSVADAVAAEIRRS